LQPKPRLALSLAAIALAACVDSNAPVEVRAPEATPPSTALPSISNQILTPSFARSTKPSQSEFNITLRFLLPPTTAQRATFAAAVARWEKLIIKDKPDETEDIPPNFCGIGGVPAYTETIDDLAIDVILAPIDGPGKILGAAGPCAVRNSDLLSVYGIMFFDVADVAELQTLGIFDEVIVHEMGHVLGIGTLWDPVITGLPGLPDLLKGETTSSPFFVGKRANVGYKQLGGAGFVPVEGDFGPGTRLSHWDEATFGNELMTGFISITGPSPLSDVTAGSLRDLGYVAHAQGESSYQLPTPAAAAAMNASVQGIKGIDIANREILLAPKFVN
jgi:leishmanolysin